MTEPASDPQRSAQRLQWARTQLDDGNAVVERASVDAGMRSYWRTTSQRGSHIVMDAPPGLEDPTPWLRMRGLLHDHGLRVPALLAHVARVGSVAGFTGMETGRRFPMDMAELGPILSKYGISVCGGWFSGLLLEGDIEAEKDRIAQQLDGLLQLRGHRKLLTELELQGRLEH